MTSAIGYAIGEQDRRILADLQIDAAEILFEQADDPLRVDRYLGDCDPDYISVHTRALSVGSADPPVWNCLEALCAFAREYGANAVSDHLGFTRNGNHGVELEHPAPLPRTPAALDAVCRNIGVIQEYLDPLPFFVENIAALFQFRGTMSEREFLSRVLERTGCGWLLDLTNLYANGRNFGFDSRAFLEEVLAIPRHVQIHLAGGYWDDRSGFYRPARSQPVSDDVFDLYRQAVHLGRGKIDAVFIERDQEFPDDPLWREEIQRVRGIAEEIEVLA